MIVNIEIDGYSSKCFGKQINKQADTMANKYKTHTHTHTHNLLIQCTYNFLCTSKHHGNSGLHSNILEYFYITETNKRKEMK